VWSGAASAAAAANTHVAARRGEALDEEGLKKKGGKG
jgi:hypothetical protein